MAERDAVVKDKTFAAPTARRLRHALEIFQDSALEMIDLGKAARLQIRAGLFAANAAGAEHRYLAMLRRIELPLRKILELAEALEAGIERAFEGAQRDLECIAGVDHEHARGRDQIVPVGRLDID